MSNKKKIKEKLKLHPRNKNRGRYDLNALVKKNPQLKAFVKPNKHGNDSIDFANPKAIKELNKAILHYYYGIVYWDFPDTNLCPPIPGRADYIHYLADLISEHNFGRSPEGSKIKCLDIGTGASCIYPILGVTEYDWRFISTDIDLKSIDSAKKIISSNPSLKSNIECRVQKNITSIFNGILDTSEFIDITLCNPPFHESLESAVKENQRKVKNLSGKINNETLLNFSGNSNELVYEGGELNFISNIIHESEIFAENCFWFTTLVAKQSNLKGIYKLLNNEKVTEIKTIKMGTGNKVSRIVIWTFLSKEQQNEWRDKRWK